MRDITNPFAIIFLAFISAALVLLLLGKGIKVQEMELSLTDKLLVAYTHNKDDNIEVKTTDED